MVSLKAQIVVGEVIMVFQYLFLFLGAIGLTVLLVCLLFIIVGSVGLISEGCVRFLRWALGIRSPSDQFRWLAEGKDGVPGQTGDSSNTDR